MARPSKFRQELLDEICERLAEGEPLAAICREDKFPTDRTVRTWALERSDVSSAIARARLLGYDAIADECMEIADDARNDWMAMLSDEEQLGYKFNGEHVQRSKLRIETRLKLLAKWDPKRYGERQQIESTINVTRSAAELSDDELAAIAAGGKGNAPCK